MDLQEQLKNLFPDHIESEPEEILEEDHVLFSQRDQNQIERWRYLQR